MFEFLLVKILKIEFYENLILILFESKIQKFGRIKKCVLSTKPFQTNDI